MTDDILGKIDMQETNKSSFYLFRYFQITSLAAIVVILIVAVMGLRSIFLDLVLYEAENDAARVSLAITEYEMNRFFRLNHDNEDSLFISDEELPKLDRELRSFLAPFDIVKIKVFNPETRIIYSTDSTIIGRLDPDNEKLSTALSGSPISKYETKDTVWDLDDEQRTDVEIVETYIPIRSSNGKIIGSFEVYKDVTPALQMADRTLVRAGAVLTATVLIVFGILMFVIQRAAHVINTRAKDLTVINKLLTQEIEERKYLEKEILGVSEKEQRRIGQELHDSIGQQLTGISFMSKALGRKLNSKSLAESADAEQIAKLISQTIEQTRGLSRGLYPVDVGENGLELALKELVTSTKALFGIQCTLEYDKAVSITDNVVAVHLYRIVQEAISNGIKHGKTKNVLIKLASNQEHSTLTVENDGFDFPDEKIKKKGIGMHIMNYRAETIGGSLDIERSPKGGTIVTCVFPNKKHYEKLRG